MMRTTLLLAALSCSVACPPSPVNPPLDADAAIVIVEIDAGSDVCARACAVLRAAGCPSGGILADGGDACEKVCAHSREPGGFDLKPECIATKTDRAGILSCGTVKCR